MQNAEVPQLLTCTIRYAFFISSDTYESCTEPNLLPSPTENLDLFCCVGFLSGW